MFLSFRPPLNVSVTHASAMVEQAMNEKLNTALVNSTEDLTCLLNSHDILAGKPPLPGARNHMTFFSMLEFHLRLSSASKLCCSFFKSLQNQILSFLFQFPRERV